MIRVWGRTNSANVMKVLWLLDELSLSYERIDAGQHHGRNNTAEYIAMNPAGLVPTLEENGFSLFESNAILRYVGNAYDPGGPWYPAAPRARAEVDAWLDLQQTTMIGPMSTVFRTLVRTPPEQRDMVACMAALAAWGRAWGMLANRLADRDFIAGAAPSIADIAWGTSVHRWFAMVIARPELPALRGWYERLLARAPFAAHVAQPLS
jgi:glutathione S-transferase